MTTNSTSTQKSATEAPRFDSFKEFYPFYLSEHSNLTCRRLHVVGTILSTATILFALFSGQWLLLLVAPLIGYGCSWIGHFFFEGNKPATFKHPIYSFMGDFFMVFDVLRGKVPIR